MSEAEKLTHDDEMPTVITKVFRERARRLRISALTNLVMVISLLIVGIGVFVFAGTLASKESEQVIAKDKRARLEFVKLERSKLNYELDDLNRTIGVTEERLTSETEGSVGTGRAGQGPVYRSIADRLRSLQSDREGLRVRIKDLEQQEATISEDIVKGTSTHQNIFDQNQLSVLISAIATRVGAIVLLLFLIKILVPLYRYNVKLASYYDARADALQMGLLEGRYTLQSFETLAVILTPAKIDFTASPDSPADQAIELAKHVVANKKLP